jgi:flagellar protein FlaG
MSTDINLSAATLSNRPAVASNQEAKQAAAASNTKPTEAPRPEIKLVLPEKSDLQFDPKEMQRNLQEAIERLNEQMKNNGRQLNFSVDKTIDRTVVQVKNAETGEVIRQIPDETLLRVAHSIEQVKGMLLDEKS